jgi:cell division protein FtsW (lipid II flippase)
MSGRRKGKSRAAGVGGGYQLYLLVLLILLAGYGMVMTVRLAHAPVVRLTDLIPVGAMALPVLVFALVFGGRGYGGDRLLPPLVLLLAGLGLLIQFRLGTLEFDEAARSSLAYPLGAVVYLLAWALFRKGRGMTLLAGAALPSLFIAVAVLAVILVFGQRFRGAVFLAGQVNPAEVIKPLLAVFLAGVITDFRKPLQQTVAGIPAPPMRSLATLGVLWALPMALLVAQRDLGMILLMNLTLVVLLFMATGRWGYLVLGGAAAAAVGALGVRLFAHAQARFLAWQDPFTDPTGKGWQILQSLSAMFSGGLWGSGLGAGAPTVVPIAASDFVYAAYAEELGFVGCLLLVMIYLLVFLRGYRVADHLRAPFPQTLAAALTTLLALQTLMNLGGVTKAIPLTGITLPLISHGGSSLVVSLAMLGLLTALSEPGGKRG